MLWCPETLLEIWGSYRESEGIPRLHCMTLLGGKREAYQLLMMVCHLTQGKGSTYAYMRWGRAKESINCKNKTPVGFKRNVINLNVGSVSTELWCPECILCGTLVCTVPCGFQLSAAKQSKLKLSNFISSTHFQTHNRTRAGIQQNARLRAFRVARLSSFSSRVCSEWESDHLDGWGLSETRVQ